MKINIPVETINPRRIPDKWKGLLIDAVPFAKTEYEALYCLKNKIFSPKICSQCDNRVSYAGGYYDCCSDECREKKKSKRHAETRALYKAELPWISSESEYHHCKQNDIKSVPLCRCGAGLKYISKNYSKYCSPKCCNSDPALGKQKLETCKSVMKEKYGVEFASQVHGAMDKRRQNWLEKYGTPHIINLPEIQEKRRETWRKNLGVEHPTHDNGIMSKIQISGYRMVDAIHPVSGNCYRVQGYEPYVLSWLWETFSETDILLGKSSVPRIMYRRNGTLRRYYPDAFILSQNCVIEVKSSYTVLNETLPFKKEASRRAGYSFRLIVWCRKENRAIVDEITFPTA